ncbi:hypothetical protein [Bradyrhizobium sp. USDA 4504]
MFPKTGKKFPGASGGLSATYALGIAEILRRELGNTHRAHKTLMRWTGANERTVKNWIAGLNGPSGEHLLHLIRNSDAVFERVLQLSERKPVPLDRRLSEVRSALHGTIELLSEILQEERISKP